jgi:hypothetical protein
LGAESNAVGLQKQWSWGLKAMLLASESNAVCFSNVSPYNLKGH